MLAVPAFRRTQHTSQAISATKPADNLTGMWTLQPRQLGLGCQQHSRALPALLRRPAQAQRQCRACRQRCRPVSALGDEEGAQSAPWHRQLKPLAAAAAAVATAAVLYTGRALPHILAHMAGVAAQLSLLNALQVRRPLPTLPRSACACLATARCGQAHLCCIAVCLCPAQALLLAQVQLAKCIADPTCAQNILCLVRPHRSALANAA